MMNVDLRPELTVQRSNRNNTTLRPSVNSENTSLSHDRKPSAGAPGSVSGFPFLPRARAGYISRTRSLEIGDPFFPLSLEGMLPLPVVVELPSLACFSHPLNR